MADTFLDALDGALASRARHGPGEVALVALLWPDQSRQWSPMMRLVGSRRLVLELGGYAPDALRGPAYWIRAVLDGVVRCPSPDAAAVPVVYLPGYARSDVRAVEEADAELKPLAELQYRGSIFAQQNGRDWTVAAFLQSRAGGLGIEVGEDDATREALLRARAELASLTVDELRHRAPLRAAYFDSLLAPDLDRDVLRWLDDPADFRASLDPERWAAFRSRFADRFGLELDAGEIAVAGQLGMRAGPWSNVWQRYCEAPDRYPTIEQHLRAAAPKRARESASLWDGPLGAWPQDNEEAEARLRSALVDAARLDPSAAADRLIALDQEHADRRGWVWAQLGHAPLAIALEHLVSLATATHHIPALGSVRDMAEAYTAAGWRPDDALQRALAATPGAHDRDVVASAACAVYVPWLDAAARRFQEAVGEAGIGYDVEPLPDWPPGTCLVFIDGLRYDVAVRVQAVCAAQRLAVTLGSRLAALPTITSTAKPAVSPIVGELGAGSGLGPAPKAGGADLSIAVLRSLLHEAGYQVLADSEAGDPQGRAWTEHGDIDELGHKQQAKLPSLLDGEVRSLAERVVGLLEAGWSQVVIVTDHGWLYVPGGLPKVELPYYLTKDERMRKGRTGRLADGAVAPGGTVPWYWDHDVRMAVAPGIAAFVAGEVYEHGGVSLEECVVPVVTIRAPAGPAAVAHVTLHWRGLRADVEVEGAPAGSIVDIRYKAGAAETSLLGQPAAVDAQGAARVLVADDDALGRLAFLVLLGPSGQVLAQETVTVGGHA